MVNVLADKHLFNIEAYLPEEVNLTLYDPQIPLPEIPGGTQALLIRTDTTMNVRSFPNLPSSLKFVATASSGTDHVDISYLKRNGITFADASGCNARAVAEYIATGLIIWTEARNIDPETCPVGIIGVGNAGSAVKHLLEKLGMNTVAYDPPREERESGFVSATRYEVLESDILTFHTPLTNNTKHPTRYWLNDDNLKNRHFKLVINAARGGVVDEEALLEAYQNDQIDDYIIDVWENEPVFNDETARHAYISTPHIAGYSLQAKHNASAAVAAALGRRFSLNMPSVPPPQKNKALDIPSSVSSFAGLLRYLHPVRAYNRKFTSLISEKQQDKKAAFSRIRTNHPLRHEYHALSVEPRILEQFPQFKMLAEG